MGKTQLIYPLGRLRHRGTRSNGGPGMLGGRDRDDSSAAARKGIRYQSVNGLGEEIRARSHTRPRPRSYFRARIMYILLHNYLYHPIRDSPKRRLASPEQDRSP